MVAVSGKNTGLKKKKEKRKKQKKEKKEKKLIKNVNFCLEKKRSNLSGRKKNCI